jgi:hypothetical protein
MANCTLWSRTVELHTDDENFMGGDSGCVCTVEQTAGLGSAEEQNSVDLPSQQEG